MSIQCYGDCSNGCVYQDGSNNCTLGCEKASDDSVEDVTLQKYGEVAKRRLPTNHVEAIKEMVSELLDRAKPNFDTTTFIVHETDEYLTVGMKWEQE